MHLRVRTNGRRSKLTRQILAPWGRRIEQLEERRLLSITVPQDADGWSVFTQTGGGRKIYVSSSEGSDSNNGLSPNTPVATLAKAKSLMRDGKDDWMLLLRGDVWDEPIGAWHTSGPSASDPQLISYYSPDPNNPLAGDRPLIDSGTNDGIYMTGHASNIAIDGLQFTPNSINGTSYDGTNSTGVAGMRFQLTGSNYLVEDCLVDGYKDNIVVANPGSPVNGFTLRRSESLDSYNATGAHSQGLYVSGAGSNILIEENTFDHNGWNDNVKGAQKTYYNHNMYINTGATNVSVLDNVVTRGSLRGTLLRAGGTVEGNFYDQNAVGIQVDNTNSIVQDNVILEGDDLPTLPSGVGIDVSFDMPSVDIENNIVAHDISNYTYNVSGIDVEQGTGQATVANNIVYDWRRPLIDGTNDAMTATGNDFEEFNSHHSVINARGSIGPGEYSDNTYYDPNINKSFEIGDNISTDQVSFNTWKSQTSDNSGFIGQNGVQAPDYVDPNRSMATYAAYLGLPANEQTFNGWVAEQRDQSHGNWNNAFTATAEDAYIRAGFTPAGQSDQNLPQVSVALSTINGSDSSDITETTGTGVFTLTRTGATDSTLSVNFAVTGTATSGVDYTLSQTTAFFGIGVSSIPIDVFPIHDTNVTQPVTVKLDITASTSNPPTYMAGENSSATLTINDIDGSNSPPTPPNNPPPPGDNGGGSGGYGGSTGNGTGLKLRYYNNQDLVGNPVYTTTATSIGLPDSTSSPAQGVNATHFSALWTGIIQATTTGTYTFTISVDSDAAVRLFVDDGGDDDTAQIDLRPNHRMADANDDGSVNSSDFDILAANFGTTTNAYWNTGDFNGDGVVNALDFNALATNFGKPDPRQPQTLTGTVQLEAGAPYDMRLEYSQKVGDSKLTFSWTPPGSSSPSAVPTVQLYPGSGAGAISVFAPDMSDSSGAASPDAGASTSSLFSSTPITNDQAVLG